MCEQDKRVHGGVVGGRAACECAARGEADRGGAACGIPARYDKVCNDNARKDNARYDKACNDNICNGAVWRAFHGVARGIAKRVSVKWHECLGGVSTHRAKPREEPVRGSLPIVCFVACGLWVGIIAVTSIYEAAVGVSTDVPDALRSGRCVLVALEDSKDSGFGSYATMQMVGTDGRLYKVQAVMDEAALSSELSGRILARQQVSAYAAVTPLRDANAVRYRHQGVVARVRLSAIRPVEDSGPVGAVLALRRWAMGCFEGYDTKGAALMRAVLLGDRSQLDRDGLYDDMKAAGLAHMVAVSGAHLAIVGALVMSFLRQVGAGRRIMSVVVVVLYALYALFTGLAASVVRAALMSGVALGAVWGRRRSSSLSALCICVCVMLAADPTLAFSLSFFLSAASTWGIVVFAPLFAQWLDAMCAGRMRKVTDAFALTAAANVTIFPVTVCVFSRVPLLSPFSNLIAAPLLTLLLVAGFGALVSCMVIPQVGRVLLSGVVMCADAAATGAHAFACVPYASAFFSMEVVVAVVLTVCVVVALWVAWPVLSPRKARQVGVVFVAALVALAVVLPLSVPDRIVMLDVGQGDAFLIQSRGAAMLVDTGNQDSALAAALGRQGVTKLDAVLISHHDDDHCASLATLQSSLGADGRVLLFKDTFDCPCANCTGLMQVARRTAGAEDVQPLSYGDTVQVGRFTCRVVWPHAFSDQGGNADSVCLRVSYDGNGDGIEDFVTLMCGDAEADQLSEIAASGDVGDIDVLKEGHHGSRAGMTDQLAQTLAPEVVLISVGANNRYGHPAPETLACLDRVGARVFRTDEEGDVSCVFSTKRVQVSTMTEG